MADIQGTPNQDSLQGTDGADHMSGGDGNDFLSGRGGDDEVEGEGGNDSLSGGDGNDLVRGGEGNDVLDGGEGDDVLHGGNGNDFLGSNANQNDEFYGEAGDDRLFYTASTSPLGFVALLDGGDGDDEFTIQAPGQPGHVTAIGGNGFDRIAAGYVDMTIDAGAQADMVTVTAYKNDYQIALGTGSDLLLVGSNQGHKELEGSIVVSDFEVGDGGDALNVAPYLLWQLFGWSGTTNPFAEGFLRVEQRGADAVLQVDRDAGRAGDAFEDLVVLQNVTATALTARNLGGYAADGSQTPGTTIDGLATPDFVNGTSGNDTIRGFGGNDGLFGGAGGDLLEGGEGNDELDGGLGNDLLHGGIGDDTLNDVSFFGGGGSDALFGEEGNDTLFVDRQFFPESGSNLWLDGGEGNDQIYFYGVRGRDDVTIVGGAGTDFIRTYLGRNVTVDAGDGNDFVGVDLGSSNSVVTLGTGSDSIELSMTYGPVVSFLVTDFQAGAGGDKFYLVPVLQRLVIGWDYANPTNPFSDNFLRVARDGSDTLLLYNEDGEGTDYSLLGRLANVDAGQLTAFNFGYDFGTVRVAGTDGADTLLGTAAADEVFGFAGDDVLDGAGGNDMLIGGAGNDTYYVDAAGDVVSEAAGGGNDRVLASASYALGAGVDVEILGTTSDAGLDPLNLKGNELANALGGNAGANRLDGGGGADTLKGLAGNDWYYVDNAGDVVIEGAAEGTFDRIFTSISYAQGAGVWVEALSTDNEAGSGAINLAGNELANLIRGNAGVNVLDGRDGADSMAGVGGSDWYYVDNAGDVVTEGAAEGGFDRIFASVSYVQGAGVYVEALSTDNEAGVTAINLSGNELANLIRGNAGANVLNGGGGADTMAGVGGNDWYYVDNAGDAVTEGASEGTFDRVFASTSYALGAGVYVEALTTANEAGTGAINLGGNELANLIRGNAGSNVLDGGAGADTLTGLGGDDWYYVDNAGDVVVEGAGQGAFDRIFASVGYTQGAGVQVEALSTDNEAGTGAINLTGNELTNLLRGNAGANVLDGGAGADTMTGLAGDDWYYVDNTGDVVVEGAGQGTFDRIFASASYTQGIGVQVEALTTVNEAATAAIELSGNELANLIRGNAGANVLNGGGGADVLTGLGGADVFRFTTALGGGNVDAITDFNVADDTIQLDDAVFTGLAAGVLTAGAFNTGATATQADDRIVYNSASGALLFDVDGVGGAAGVQFATVTTGLALTSADFFVI